MIYSKSFALLIIVLFSGTLSQSCSSKKNAEEDENMQALVTVNGKTLYRNEVSNLISKDFSSADSTLTAEAYIKMWIKKQLMYEKAAENLSDKDRIDELVENYRVSLTIFTYQEQLLNQRLSKEITDKELLGYYEKNPEQFRLKTNIIKGLFLKVPLASLRLDDLRKWYKSASEKAIENIEKYSLENAVIYDYFYNNWVDLDEVMNNIPIRVDNPVKFLKENKNIEVQDSSYVYLLNIKEYLLTDNQAPFEFAKNQIMDILISQKREGFIKKFENDLYEEALNQNQIKFHNK